jgi:hypothetical protein
MIVVRAHISPGGLTIGPLETAVQRHRLILSTWSSSSAFCTVESSSVLCVRGLKVGYTHYVSPHVAGIQRRCKWALFLPEMSATIVFFLYCLRYLFSPAVLLFPNACHILSSFLGSPDLSVESLSPSRRTYNTYWIRLCPLLTSIIDSIHLMMNCFRPVAPNTSKQKCGIKLYFTYLFIYLFAVYLTTLSQ